MEPIAPPRPHRLRPPRTVNELSQGAEPTGWANCFEFLFEAPTCSNTLWKLFNTTTYINILQRKPCAEWSKMYNSTLPLLLSTLRSDPSGMTLWSFHNHHTINCKAIARPFPRLFCLVFWAWHGALGVLAPLELLLSWCIMVLVVLLVLSPEPHHETLLCLHCGLEQNEVNSRHVNVQNSKLYSSTILYAPNYCAHVPLYYLTLLTLGTSDTFTYQWRKLRIQVCSVVATCGFIVGMLKCHDVFINSAANQWPGASR